MLTKVRSIKNRKEGVSNLQAWEPRKEVEEEFGRRFYGPSSPSPIKLQISEHSIKQYWRLRKPCLKTTRGLLILRGPSPGDPKPPLMQVLTHLTVQVSAFLDLGRWIRGFLQSSLPETELHSPDKVCGTLDSVSLSAPASAATADNTAADAAAATAAVASITLNEQEIQNFDGVLLGLMSPAFTCTLLWHIRIEKWPLFGLDTGVLKLVKRLISNVPPLIIFG